MQTSESLVIECQYAVRAARAGKIRLALDAARLGYQRARQAGSDSDRLLALNTMAFCQSMNGAYIEAMASAMDAYPLALKTGDAVQATQALSLAAAASVFMLDTREMASAILDQCLSDAAKLNDPTLDLLVRNCRGVVFLTQQKYAESIAEFELALQLLEHADGTTPRAVVQTNIASSAMRQANAIHDQQRTSRQQAAEHMLLDALDAARTECSLEAESRARYALGALYANRQEYPQALTELKAALALSEELTHRYRAMVTRSEMAGVYTALGQLDDAQKMIEEALDEAETRRPCRELHRLCSALADLEVRRGKPEAAARAWARADKEREAFERDGELARQDLAQLWHNVSQSAKPAAS